ncbi:hypothetical protein Tco_1404569 [Tanacetum coccineum]
MPNPKPSIPYPSRRNDEKRRENADEQKEKFYKIFKNMSFEISFMDALTLMPKFASTLKALIRNKEKLSEMARTPLNEHCSAVILNNYPGKKHVYEGELILQVDNEAITYNLDQTSRYSVNYNDMTANRIDIVELACKEYSQEVLGFSDVIANAQNCQILIDEPPEVELKDLPPHLEYAFLEDNNKFLVIISKDLSIDEKTALIKVLQSRKRAIAWKLSDIKGINLEFCSHKILMEEDYEPAVQHQRRVNPKIHDVIKKEVENFLTLD